MPELQFDSRSAIKTNPKLLFCDVDRTLLTHDHVLLPVVSKAARSLVSVDLPIILASARSPVGLERVHSRVEASDFVCCFNGAWVGRLSTRQTLVEKRLNRELATEVFSVVHDMGGSPIWFDLERCFVLEPDAGVARQRTNATGDSLQLIKEPSEAPGAPFKLLATFQEELIHESVANLSAVFAGTLTVARSGPRLVELVRNDTRKDWAAASIAAEFGLHGDDVAAAGDSDNDLEMLRWAGLAITVANANPRIKALAEIVAPSCDDGGLALALNWLVEHC
jgi:hypothetical protein